MQTQQLNLARKWRSKQFDQVVGQELSVRMLKNSLYLNQFFPVYLFSGQRGCGKTTTARVFAAALNCQQLPDFQTNPKAVIIPCLSCESCVAMASGNHPDFIEMDAASNTGVDNVRTIIEAAALLPVMGRKKIYLIDEAHMLSKAAFNAFLKLLEEPPASVIFMLATTDPQKIIDTVRSRCFQLFFNAIDTQKLVAHLEAVCETEQIKAEKKALLTIVKETEGSARDALNLLEQVRFASGAVTQETVLKSLGHLSEQQLLNLFEVIIEADTQKLLNYLEAITFEKYNPLRIWHSFLELVRAVLFMQCGVTPQIAFVDQQKFTQLVQQCSSQQLTHFLQLLYDQELLLTKTTVQHGLLEMLFLRMCSESKKKTDSKISVVTQQGQEKKQKLDNSTNVMQSSFRGAESDVESSVSVEPLTPSVRRSYNEGGRIEGKSSNSTSNTQWQTFIEKIQNLSDPLLLSIFRQAQLGNFDAEKNQIDVQFAKEAEFFKDWLKDTEKIWVALLQEVFGAQVSYTLTFLETVKAATPVVQKTAAQVPEKRAQQPVQKAQNGSRNNNFGSASKNVIELTDQVNSGIKEVRLDISDKEKWKTANQLQEAFGGTITEVINDEKAA